MIQLRHVIKNNAYRAAVRFYGGTGHNESTSGGSASGPLPPAQVNADVPGLSSVCVHTATQPVGPGVDPKKTGAYKVPEYFCYNNITFYEAEVEMSKFRCPQPSALKK